MVSNQFHREYQDLRAVGYGAGESYRYAKALLWCGRHGLAWRVDPAIDPPDVDPTCYSEREIQRMTAWRMRVWITVAAPECPHCGHAESGRRYAPYLGNILAIGDDLPADDEYLFLAELAAELYATYGPDGSN